MEAYNIDDEKETITGRIGQALEVGRSYVSIFLGVIVAVLGVLLIFIVASLEGTKEVKASNSLSGKLLTQWREENFGYYPEEKVEIIIHKDREYYFVIDSYNEDMTIKKWYWAYDGGIDYLFTDVKFYILTALAIMIGMYVSYINYITTIKQAKQSKKFLSSLKYYQERKGLIKDYTQYLSVFCVDKNAETYNNLKSDIIQSANIKEDFYNSKEFNVNSLEKWQKKILKKIRKIKVKRIKSGDLLQEANTLSSKVELLPMSEVEHLKRFLYKGFIQRILTSLLSGLVVGFGVILGNWVLGLTYGITIIFAYATSVIVATDFVHSTLRNRYIAKGDLLQEFYNIKEKYIPEVKEEIKDEPKQQLQQL